LKQHPTIKDHRGGKTDTNKSNNPYAQSQRDQVPSDSVKTAKILEEEYNEHIIIYTDGFKKRQKSWMRSDNTKPKA
jgi:hypothetical protein